MTWPICISIPWFLCSDLHQIRIRQNTSEHFLLTKCMLLTVAISYIDTPYKRVMDHAVILQVFVTYYFPKFPFWQICAFDGFCLGPDRRSGIIPEYFNTSSPYSTHRSQVSRECSWFSRSKFKVKRSQNGSLTSFCRVSSPLNMLDRQTA